MKKRKWTSEQLLTKYKSALSGKRRKGWNLIPTEVCGGGLMECADCGHKGYEYAEHDDVIQVGGVPLKDCKDEIIRRIAKGDNNWDGTLDGDEVCCQVRCPNCKSWFYWDYPAYSKEEIQSQANKRGVSDTTR